MRCSKGLDMKWSLYMSSNQQNLTIGSIRLKSDYRIVKYHSQQDLVATQSGKNDGKNLWHARTAPSILGRRRDGSGGAEESISLSKQEPTAAMAAMAGAGSVVYIGTTAK